MPVEGPVVNNICAMGEPLPLDEPVTPDAAAVQLKTVPETVLVSAIELASPEQIVCVEGTAVAIGFGITVTVTDTVEPVHVAVVGVTKYTAVPGVGPVAIIV